MGDSVGCEMIALLISKCENNDMMKGLKTALNIISNEGYYNLTDWEEMTDEEQWDEVKEYLK